MVCTALVMSQICKGLVGSDPGSTATLPVVFQQLSSMPPVLGIPPHCTPTKGAFGDVELPPTRSRFLLLPAACPRLPPSSPRADRDIQVLKDHRAKNSQSASRAPGLYGMAGWEGSRQTPHGDSVRSARRVGNHSGNRACNALRHHPEIGRVKTPPEGPEAPYGPFKRIRKWTSGLIGPDFAFQVTTMVTPAATVAPVESVADTQT